MNVHDILVFGDSKIVIKHVRNATHCVSNHLKNYQQLVQDLICNFSTFNITPISRLQNVSVDLLANVASKLIPPKDFSPDRFSVELIFKPSIPDNIANWRFFNDDEDIINFITSEGPCYNDIADEDSHDHELNQSLEGDKIKSENIIPISIVKLEDF
jgi:hypothetical protein